MGPTEKNIYQQPKNSQPNTIYSEEQPKLETAMQGEQPNPTFHSIAPYRDGYDKQS